METADVWLERALQHDADALAALLRHHYDGVYKYLLKITMNRLLAEELVQETMIRAIERLASFQRKAKFSTWLMSIATRLYLDEIRKRQREQKQLQHEQVQALRSLRFETELRRDDWPEALDALARLEPGSRVPIMLKHYYGYGYEEIAQWMGISAGTVKSRVHYGLERIRKELSLDES